MDMKPEKGAIYQTVNFVLSSDYTVVTVFFTDTKTAICIYRNGRLEGIGENYFTLSVFSRFCPCYQWTGNMLSVDIYTCNVCHIIICITVLHLMYQLSLKTIIISTECN